MTADRARAGRTGSCPLFLEVADTGSIQPFGDEVTAGNTSGWPGYEEQLQSARHATGARHSVTTGVARIDGEPCVLVGFDFSFLGGSLGVAEGTRITRAFSVAIADRLPIVCVAASGGSRMQEGASALVQFQAVSAAIAAARRAGIPHVAVAGDPTTGGVWASLIASADVIISVPGARVGFSGTRTRPQNADPGSPEYLADGKWAHGFADVLTQLPGLRGEVARAVRLLSPRMRSDVPDPAPLPAWPTAGDGDPMAGLSAWDHVTRARASGRPTADQWLAGYFGDTLDIRGDRCGGVDTGLRCGFGSHEKTTIAFIAQTGGQTTPAGFRTAARLLELAGRLRLPVLTLIDTPGASATPVDEAAGVGPAIAGLFIAVASSRVPITSVVIGEGVSGGALAMAAPGRLWIARDGYLAVTTPELAASILRLGAEDIPEVADWLRLTPAELASRGIVRGIIAPPSAGAGSRGG
jgi:acyl-CoA carboxylase subunit beta